MLSKRALRIGRAKCKSYSTARRSQPVQVLPDANVDTIRNLAFERAIPALLPRQAFAHLPAIEKLFIVDEKTKQSALNADFLAQHGDTIVPLELSNADTFTRVEQPLSVFVEASKLPPTTTRIYLAQCPLPTLPLQLQHLLPVPTLVLNMDKGDIYDSSLWLGAAPTYTPLHRDPNPNLFVQLAGTKRVRLFRPKIGDAIFARVQERIGAAGSATMRGEEMMKGREKEVLEEVVWGEDGEGEAEPGLEAELGSGDGLFIPKGWWHSIKGVGEGMTGSVNWWFR